MNIAIIPARGGSKRIINKNIKSFFGKPIIFWTIDKLKKTKIFDKIYISTDSKKISKIAKKLNCDVLYPRPKYLSNDYAKTLDVIKYEIKKLNKKKILNICCMYPAAPLTSINDIIKGYRILKKNRDKFVVSSCKPSFDIDRVYYKKKKYVFKNSKLINSRSQDLKEYLHDAGQFYWASVNNWIKSKNIFFNFLPLEVSSIRFCDINNKNDWARAEVLFKILKN